LTRIVTTTYRYKPPPKRKGRKLAEITGPAVVVGKGSRRPVWEKAGPERVRSKSTRLEKAGEAQPTTPPERQRDPVVTTARKAPAPANNDGPRRSVIVAARKHRSWRSDVPEMTEEERPTR
jgi:hypothetical protein